MGILYETTNNRHHSESLYNRGFRQNLSGIINVGGKLIAEGLPDGTITREYLYMDKVRIAMVEVAA